MNDPLTAEQIKEKVRLLRDYYRAEANKLKPNTKAYAVERAVATAYDVLFMAICANDLTMLRHK